MEELGRIDKATHLNSLNAVFIMVVSMNRLCRRLYLKFDTCYHTVPLSPSSCLLLV